MSEDTNFTANIAISGLVLGWTAVGHAVVQLVEALRHKSESRGFDSRWCHWNFSLTQSFRPHCGPGVDTASNRNKYQGYSPGGKGGRCLRLTTLPLSMCRLSWNLGTSISWNPQGLSRPVMRLLLLLPLPEQLLFSQAIQHYWISRNAQIYCGQRLKTGGGGSI